MTEFVISDNTEKMVRFICDSCGFVESIEYCPPTGVKPRLHPLPHGWKSLVKGIVPEGILAEPESPEMFEKVAELYREKKGHDFALTYEKYLELSAEPWGEAEKMLAEHADVYPRGIHICRKCTLKLALKQLAFLKE